MKALHNFIITTIFCGITTQASAIPMTFFGEDRGIFDQNGVPSGVDFVNSKAAESEFLSHLVGVGTEDFESFSDGTNEPLNMDFPGAGSATLSGSGEVDNDPGTGQNATSGNNWWRTGANGDFTITFDNPVAAFGFFGIDIGDVGAQLTLTLANGSSIDIDIPHTLESGGPSSGQNGSVIYFGYIDEDNPWTSATFSNPDIDGGDDFGFDDMTIGSIEQVETPPVPEPSTLLLFIAGLFGLGAAKRRFST